MNSRWNIAQALARLGGEKYPRRVSAAKGAAKVEVSTAVGGEMGRVGTTARSARGDGKGLAAVGSRYDGSHLVMLGSGSVEGSSGGVEVGGDIVKGGGGVEGDGGSVGGGEGGIGGGRRRMQAVSAMAAKVGMRRRGTLMASEGGGDGGEGVVCVVGNVGDGGWMAVAAVGIAHTGAYIYGARRAHGPRWCC